MSRSLRSEVEREERRGTLLAAARNLFATLPYARVRMEDVARAAGVAKGTVFLYFQTKDALFLGVLRVAIDEWLDDVVAALDAELIDTDDALTALLVRSLVRRPELVRLLTLWPAVLESGAPPEDARAFRHHFYLRVADTGAAIDRVVPGMPAGEGARLLLRLHAVVIGLGPLSAGEVGDERPSAVSPALADELPQIVASLVRGATVA